MKTKMAGAALAAMVGACALVSGIERAEAYQINLQLNASASGLFRYVMCEDGYGCYNSGYYTNAQFNISEKFVITSNERGIIEASSGPDQIRLSGDSISISFKSNVFGYNDYPTFNEVVFYGGIDPLLPCSLPYYCGNVSTSYDINYTDPFGNIGRESGSGGGAYFITVVPLPAAAPLFGAALLALGGLGYARRRGAPA